MVYLDSRFVRVLGTSLLVTVCLAGLLLGCGGEPGEADYRDGLRELARGRHARAKVLLEKSIARRPASEENALAYNYLGVASSRMGQRDKAIDEFEESRRLNPDLLEPAYNLSVLMYEGGNVERAIQLLQEASVGHVEDTRTLEYLGRIYLDQRDMELALRTLNRALDRVPGSPSVLTALALAEGQARGADVAVSYFMRALEQEPDYAPALFNLALTCERELKDSDKAITFYGRYLDVAPDGAHRDYAQKAYENLLLSVDTGEASPDDGALAVPQQEDLPDDVVKPAAKSFDELLGDARAAARAGDTEQALKAALEAADGARQRRDRSDVQKALQAALELCPDEAEAHFEWGRFCLELARYERAMQAFGKAVQLRPKWPEALLGLAESATEAREFDAALVTLKQALRLDAGNDEAFWALATLYDEYLQNWDKAAATYRAFARRFPGDPRVVEVEERLGRLERLVAEEAKREAELAPKPPAPEPEPEPETVEVASVAEPPQKPEEPRPPRPRKRNTALAVQAYNSGTRHQERQDWNQAIYYYRLAIDNDSSFADAYYNLGNVYRMTGETDLAKAAYLRAVQLKPKMANARYNLALLYMDLGSFSAAIDQLRAVLKLQPDHVPTHFALGLLYSRNRQAEDLARKHYEKFLELAPEDPGAEAARAWLSE